MRDNYHIDPADRIAGPPQQTNEAPLVAFDQWRPLLFSIAYRMTGSVADAEDLLQEAYIRWQEASNGDVRSPKALLATDRHSALDRPSAICSRSARRVRRAMAPRTYRHGSFD
jgi:DNA-directed RNA polymerase specialized sigma24 family protein